MGIQSLTKLLDERTALSGVMTSLQERIVTEDRDLNEQERSELARLQERCTVVDGMLTEFDSYAESQRAFAVLADKIEASKEASAARVPAQRAPVPAETTSPGQLFVDSEQFRTYPGRGQGRALDITGFTGVMETRALITTATLAMPSFVLPPKIQDINIPPLLTVVDVVGISTGVAEWVTVTGDPKAAVVAEGAAKPEAALTFTPTSAPLDTLAHWVQITRQALEDAAYIRSVVENKLRRGLTLAIADAINAAIVAATLPTAVVASGAGVTLLNAIRVGIGTVQGNGYQPNAVLLNPADWAALDVAVMGGTLGGPTIGATFWGLTPVASTVQAAGTATVGDFRAGVTWFDRNVSSVFLSDSHQDNFIKNILVVLAETRGKAAVPEPNALCECTVGP